MAGRRLIAVLAAGCGAANAQPEQRSEIKPPAGWQALPAIASAARMTANAAGTSVVEGAEAWGEPAMGCYAIWIALAGDTGEDLAEQIQASLTAEKITVTDVKPGDTTAMTVERAPYRGRLLARGDDGKLSVLACFANDRERSACEAACTTVLSAWGTP
jgi:hypothetical protein